MKHNRFPNFGFNGLGVATLPPRPPATPQPADEQTRLLLEPTPQEAEQMALGATLRESRQGVADNPDSAWAWYRHGEALLALHRPGEALPALQKAVALSPEPLIFHFSLGLALSDLGQREAAAKEYAIVVAKDPKLEGLASTLMQDAMTHLALVQTELGQRDEAIETLLPALDNAVAVLFNLAFLHFRAGRFDATLPYIHAACTMKPNNVDVLQLYGATLDNLKRPREAAKILRQALRLDPDRDGAWNDLGLANLHLGKRNAARRCFHKALAIDPKRAWSRYNLACVDGLEGNPDAAFRNLFLAVETGFRDVTHLRRDGALDSLRRDARWKALMATIDRLDNARN
jgi:tetratricopeptide (TPR) repeat protein